MRAAEIGSQRILLLASPTSYRVAAYREAGHRLGLCVLVACDGSQALIADSIDGLRLDLSNTESTLNAIVDEHGKRPFCAVVSADDSTAELAVVIATQLGLAHNPLSAARMTRRKDLARDCLAKAGLPVPGFTRLDLGKPLDSQLRRIRFPCVVKPLAMSASRGVIRANDVAELLSACERVSKIVSLCEDADERRTLLIEDYLPGIEVAVEGLLRGGVLEILAVFDKPEPLEGPYFEETYYITPSSHSGAMQDRIRQRVGQACQAYGLVEGPVHAEARLHKGEAWLLEIAARTIGGDCARLLSFGTGTSLESLVLGSAAGLPLSTESAAGAAGVLMIPIERGGTLRRVEGLLAASTIEYVDDVAITVREGYELVPLPEGSSYLGFIFASAPTPLAVEQALRDAYACLNVIVAPVLPVEAVSCVTS